MVIVNNRDQLEWRPGMTVQDLLDELKYSYVLITVTVNGTVIPQEDYATHEVPDRAQVTVFHLAHGG